MIVRFNVKNFLSFKNMQSFSMIPKDYGNLNSHIIETNDIKLLHSSMIFGANASGKTNLIKAFAAFKDIIINNVSFEYENKYFKDDQSCKKDKTLFEIEFLNNDFIYAYGIELILSEGKLLSEWLYKLNPKKENEDKIFEREYISEEEGFIYSLGDNLIIKEEFKERIPEEIAKSIDRLIKSENKVSSDELTKLIIQKLKCIDQKENEDKNKNDIKRIDIILEELKYNQQTLLLNEMNRNKRINNDSELYHFINVYEWFDKKLEIISPKQPITNFEYLFKETSNNDALKELKSILSVFDTGVTDLKVETISEEEIRKKLPTKLVDNIIKDSKKLALDKKNAKNVGFFIRSDESFYQVNYNKKTEKVIFQTIKFVHGNREVTYYYSEESDGTRRLFDLIDIFMNIDNDKVYLIDEIDRSLHPMLIKEFIKLYYENIGDNKSQLIFSTHESSLMDLENFRQDEIWFIERDENYVSQLYSLDIFKERYDKKIDKAYLEGRYGAVPIFSKIL